MNPNNCDTCRYKNMVSSEHDDGWCYMFRHEPEQVCMQHTGRTNDLSKVLQEALEAGDDIEEITRYGKD